MPLSRHDGIIEHNSEDADAVARELQQPGTEVLRLMAEAFGQEICNADGSLNRQAVADKVFGDPGNW